MATRAPKLKPTQTSKDDLRRSLEEYLWSQQAADGHWHFALDDNATLTAEYVLFLYWMGMAESVRIQKLCQHLLKTQQEDGSWNLFYGGPGDLNATIESYFALKMSGFTADHEALCRARAFILGKGGLVQTRVFTRIWLALFGLYPWGGIPVIPPEILFAPRGLPFNLLEFSCWSRAVIIPLTVLFHEQRSVPVNFNLEELYINPEDKSDTNFKRPPPVDDSWIVYAKKWDFRWFRWDDFFIALNKGVALYETKIPIKPLRKLAVKKAKQWILSHQDPSGDWCGIIPAKMNALMALYALGTPLSSPVMQKGLDAINNFCRGFSPNIKQHSHEDSTSACLQSTVSPIWDTTLTALALVEAGVPKEDPRLQKAKEYLWNARIENKGDWSTKAKRLKPKSFACWAFQYNNRFYPDVDDTAVVLLTLYKLGMTNEELEPVVRWIKALQSSDGGWAAFDRDNNQWLLNQIPFADLKSLIDPSCADVTGHVLEAFAEMGLKNDPSVKKAIRYLRKTQRGNGSWFGRWGINTLYGTSAALVGLTRVGEPVQAPYIQKALNFILTRQNEDGGWGESARAYEKEMEDGMGHSTPSQTAWALIALHACQTPQQDFSEAIERALSYLDTRNSDEGMIEPEYTGTGFPEHFYLRYDGYRNYFPLMALGRLKTFS